MKGRITRISRYPSDGAPTPTIYSRPTRTPSRQDEVGGIQAKARQYAAELVKILDDWYGPSEPTTIQFRTRGRTAKGGSAKLILPSRSLARAYNIAFGEYAKVAKYCHAGYGGIYGLYLLITHEYAHIIQYEECMDRWAMQRAINGRRQVHDNVFIGILQRIRREVPFGPTEAFPVVKDIEEYKAKRLPVNTKASILNASVFRSVEFTPELNWREAESWSYERRAWS